ncbi:MmgE/PrpD family protein [Sinomonas gamaensis]|uniref:MmgE/PrpD family protein n=1 Tax=Sinomonas gamaensis TaxID=2565624 RepID=UPI001109F436|nr:MmgE/PrpD family protein [Sinomonas gamaensis]
MTTTAPTARSHSRPSRDAARAALTQRLAEHVTSTASGEIPDEARENAVVRVLDALGCALAGHRAPGAEKLLTLAAAWGGRGDARILGTSARVPSRTAAFAGSVLTRSFDFEPVSAEGPGGQEVAAHITGTTVPVALAEAERHGASGAQLLDALVLADDVTARLAVGSGFDVYSGQDNTGTVNGLGATALAARLAGLDGQGLVDAWGIVLQQLGGSVAPIFDHAPAFRLPMAFAAHAGITAVELAALGYRGEDDPLAGRFGFLDRFCAEPDPALMLERLGEVFCADRVIKPWSSCRASQPSLDAAARLYARGIRLADCETVRVHVTPRTAAGFVGAPWNPGRNPEVSAAFSLRFTTVAALAHGTVRPEHLLAASAPQLGAAAAAVDIVPSLPPEEYLTAEVEVLLRGGETVRERVETPLGDRHHSPLTQGDIEEKFLANAAFAGLPSGLAHEALGLALALPGAPTVSPLLDALTIN